MGVTAIIDTIISFLRGLGYWGVFFGSAIPLTEQRAAIPLGIWAMGLPPLTVMAVSFLGSLVPVPFILFFFTALINFLRRFRRLDFLTGFIDRKVRAGSKKIERYKEAGLILFIGVPLPMTGLWTGSAIAAFLGLDFKKSLICTALGGVISAVAVTVASLLFPALFGYHVR
jgi:uncharacterized membrane protein